MCTYTISINDTIIDKVRPAFADEDALSNWMQQQMELMLVRYAAGLEQTKKNKEPLSMRLRGIANAPKDFDYKQELSNRIEL